MWHESYFNQICESAVTKPITQDDLELLDPEVQEIWKRVDRKTLMNLLIASQKRVRELETEADKLAGTIDQMWKDHDKEQELQTFLEKLER